MVNIPHTTKPQWRRAWLSRSVCRRPITGRWSGHALNIALTDGFKLGFTISAALMGVSVLAALLRFRNESRGQHVNMAELAAAGIDS